MFWNQIGTYLAPISVRRGLKEFNFKLNREGKALDLVSLHHFTTFDTKRISKKLGDTVAQLSSGNRFVKASTDISSLSVSTKFQNHIQSTQSVRQNVAQASSLLQVAEGGLNEVQEILLRMTAIAQQARSGPLDNAERGFLDIEFQQLKEQIDFIAHKTNFNGVEVLNGYRYRGQTSTIDGTALADQINAGGVSDVITPFGGDDVVSAGGGNDIINSGSGTSPGLQGSIYLSGGGAITSLAQAENIAATQPLAASFTATSLDYPNGAVNSHNSTVGAFLGGDGASISNPGLLGNAAFRMVFVYDGQITVGAGGNYDFSVGSDDGFNLSINGTTVTQHTTNRGFGVSTGTVALTPGIHDFRLLYWENGGGEGLEVTSTLTGGTILDDTILSTAGAGGIDGDDTIDGGSGTDTVTFDGNLADYTITTLSTGALEVVDNRPGSPNGTDVLTNVEFLQFADANLPVKEVRPEDDVLWFDISGVGTDVLEYRIVDATVASIFDDTGINVKSSAQAETAFDAVEEALSRIIEMRAYVGSLVQKTEIVDAHAADFLINQIDADNEIAGVDIPQTSTRFVQEQVKLSASISVQAQATQLRKDVLERLLSDIGINSGG